MNLFNGYKNKNQLVIGKIFLYFYKSHSPGNNLSAHVAGAAFEIDFTRLKLKIPAIMAKNNAT